jgi:hypothetical protein
MSVVSLSLSLLHGRIKAAQIEYAQKGSNDLQKPVAAMTLREQGLA